MWEFLFFLFFYMYMQALGWGQKKRGVLVSFFRKDISFLVFKNRAFISLYQGTLTLVHRNICFTFFSFFITFLH